MILPHASKTLVLTTILLLALLATLGWAARPPRPAGPVYEYAFVLIENNLPVLVTTRQVQRIEIPLQPTDADSKTVYKNAFGTLVKRFDPLLFGLNSFAAEGWEITLDRTPTEGDRLLARRRID